VTGVREPLMQVVGKSWHRLPDGLGTLTNHRHRQSWALTKLDPNSLTTSSSTPSSRRKSTSTSLVFRHTLQISQDVRPFRRVKGTERNLKQSNDRQLANTTLIGAHQQDHRDLPHCHPLVRTLDIRRHSGKENWMANIICSGYLPFILYLGTFPNPGTPRTKMDND
jgi:hypothetical protein